MATERTGQLIVHGTALKESDYRALDGRWINKPAADAAFLRRVKTTEAYQMFDRSKGNHDGILIPNIKPGELYVRDYRERRDHPDMEQTARGEKPSAKYVSAPGRGNHAYFVPGTDPAWLTNVEIPVLIPEGEFKAIAGNRLAWERAGENASSPAYLSMGVSGASNWKATVGKSNSADGARVDVKGPLTDFFLLDFNSRLVIIAYDRDVEINIAVGAARLAFTEYLQSRGARVAWFKFPKEPREPKGLDDLLAAIGPDEVLKLLRSAKIRTPRRSSIQAPATPTQAHEGWRSDLIRTATGKPKPILANAITALRKSDEWTGLLAYDQFAMQTVALRSVPWAVTPEQWTDAEDTLTADWLQRNEIIVSSAITAEAVQTVARENSFHPVRDYLNGLKWDGRPRLDTWLSDYLGAERGARDQYLRTVGSRWAISAVARVVVPGAKVDCCLILEGPQGSGKSRSLKTLAGDWFTDEIADLGTKDSAMQTRGVWIIELAELDSLSRSDSSRIKAFMSRGTDRFRPAYGRRVIEAPRECVFAGTVNSDTYLKDETGARRFWPVRCGSINIGALTNDRDQLWAEAVWRFRNREPWWITDAGVADDAEQEQRGRYDADPWENRILAYCESRSETTVSQILETGLALSVAHTGQREANRVARVLVTNGWVRMQVRIPGTTKREYRYFRSVITLCGMSPVTSSSTGDASTQ